MNDDFLKSLQSTQQREQIETGLRDLAVMVRLYQQQLRAQGFNAIEALTLTTNFQQIIVTAAQQQGKSEG